MGLVAEGVERSEESRIFHGDLISPLEIVAESKESPQQKVSYS